ncbi:uncharacterized protein LY79DRAFT_565468 [Colletotrichum navitas]|uniref:Uncharacterized protein n=1 Tax=Colletotrichum navitas TaxID=681940 RepID=A0AAD8PQT9_9PEZI|nr:uncharacterized protein LY79DRAFT_565468 [Colletotrichum navitas]KAK1574690.1 hypothetical protein LY79DRAFT_565468 [Colletotrichum navitas]
MLSLPMELAGGGGFSQICLWVWGLADACDAVDLVEISDKEERHGTERHCQNGKHRHPFRRHQTRLPHLAAALPWAGRHPRRAHSVTSRQFHTKLGELGGERRCAEQGAHLPA